MTSRVRYGLMVAAVVVMAAGLIFFVKRAQQPRESDRLTTRALPGLTIDLPGWPVTGQRQRWPAGMIALRRANGNIAQLDWQRASSPLSAEDTTQLLQASANASPQWGKLEAPVATVVNGHPGFSVDTRYDGTPARFITWFCAEDQRQFNLTIVGAEQLVAPIVASVKCHLPAPDRNTMPHFTKLAPPPGYEPISDEVDVRVWRQSTGDHIVEIAPLPGNHTDSRELFGALGPYTGQSSIDDAKVARETAVDPQGHTRSVLRWKSTFEGGLTRDMTIHLWYCPETDDTHAILISTADTRDGGSGPEHAALLAATCH